MDLSSNKLTGPVGRNLQHFKSVKVAGNHMTEESVTEDVNAVWNDNQFVPLTWREGMEAANGEDFFYGS